jgi:DNA-binding HxlR family transcriptional regulator
MDLAGPLEALRVASTHPNHVGASLIYKCSVLPVHGGLVTTAGGVGIATEPVSALHNPQVQPFELSSALLAISITPSGVRSSTPLTTATGRSSTHRRVRCAPQGAWDVSESTAHVCVPRAAHDRHRRWEVEAADSVAAERRPTAALQRSSAGDAGVAHKVLIQQLRQLERDGLVSRTVVSEPHVQVEYCLTAFGTSLGPVLNEMAAWAKRHHGRFGATLGPLK